jgi:hypothetical protein
MRILDPTWAKSKQRGKLRLVIPVQFIGHVSKRQAIFATGNVDKDQLASNDPA